jgi:hypothetical protein
VSLQGSKGNQWGIRTVGTRGRIVPCNLGLKGSRINCRMDMMKLTSKALLHRPAHAVMLCLSMC